MKQEFETRAVNITHPDPYNPVTYDDLEPFGWVQTDALVSGLSEYAILSRDVTMHNYWKIASLDDQYFDLKNKKKIPPRINVGTLFMLLLFFLVPGLIYLIYKLLMRKSVNDYNKGLQKQMDEIASEAIKILEENEANKPVIVTLEDKKKHIQEFLYSPFSQFRYICGEDMLEKYSNIDITEDNVDNVRNELLGLYIHYLEEKDIPNQKDKREYACKLLTDVK